MTEQKTYITTAEHKTISRRVVVKGMGLLGIGALFSGPMIACAFGSRASGALESGALESGAVSEMQSKQKSDFCRLSEPGDTVHKIVKNKGGNDFTKVTVDQGNDGTIDYEGPAAVGPGLQYNEGPKALDGTPLWNKPLRDKVCVDLN